jgi:hypothetical protein
VWNEANAAAVASRSETVPSAEVSISMWAS